MEQNNNQIDNQQPCFRKVIGNTTYVVHVHFSETTKVTLEEKIERLIREKEQANYWDNRENTLKQQ
jgi:hypothetical protein